MNLLVKFNLIFVLVFGLGLVATGYTAREFLRTNARDQVLQQARLMMEAAASTRTYTGKQVRPLLEIQQRDRDSFYPQSVPAYSAMQTFGYLHARYTEYSYKEAALNPTNLVDRASDWEADVVNAFRNDRSRKELIGERDTPTGRNLFLAHPMVAAQPCLECHSVPSAAPPAMLRTYGSSNGFGWTADDVVAAQIVSVPMALPLRIADQAYLRLMLWLTAIALLSLVLLNVALVFAVIRPVRQMAAAADAISKGDLDTPEVPVRGQDEIAVLAGAFNRLSRSLVKAMKMLEE